MRPVLVGAVLYDPKVSVIWDIIRAFFAAQGVAMDCVFFTNYELQADALLAGQVDIAWNSPLAWLDARRRAGGAVRAIAMRDTDRDRVTRLLVRADSGIARIADLRGRTIATGALDSPQATLIPLQLLIRHGLAPGREVAVLRHDVAVGQHGDHVGGERDALASLLRGESDAAAVLDLNWELWSRTGSVDAASVRVLASTPPFDHCNFTVLAGFDAGRERAWAGALLAMRYDVPEHRAMMDMEGLQAWLPGRTSGYAELEAAVVAQRYFETTRA